MDDLLTETDPEFTDIPGVFAKQHNLLDALEHSTELRSSEGSPLDVVSKNYIQTKSEATHKPPAQIIGEMVRREIAAVGQ
ncbi:hypothetical protein FACS1894110_26130 [Spirochaetia bacterium]|nr:hypothetical protein FACS1894110_26130 [Spirochaetia bacterium]